MIISLNKRFISLVEKLKKDGKTIGLCSGTFDLLHPGHMVHLEQAKKLCSVLVVAIACDKHARARKGSGRPIYNEEQRVYTVSQSKPVDYAFVHRYKDSVDLLKILKPNFYIRGSDYLTGKESKEKGFRREKKTIESLGGEVKHTKSIKPTTTEIILAISNSLKKKSL